MAIPMPIVQDIRRLDRQGMSRAQIARRLHVDRGTVAKYADMEDCSPKPKADRRYGSKIDPYAHLVDGWLEADRMLPRKQRHTIRRVHDRLLAETDYDGEYSTTMRYVHRWREANRGVPDREGYVRLEWAAGSMQVDFGVARARIAGEMADVHCLVVSLPYSNMRLCVALPGENAECLCHGLMLVFEHIGGVPPVIVMDNATGAVCMSCSKARSLPEVKYIGGRLLSGFGRKKSGVLISPKGKRERRCLRCRIQFSMCHYLGGGLHGRKKRVKAQSESSKSVVNSVLISREMPVFPGFLEIIRVVGLKKITLVRQWPYPASEPPYIKHFKTNEISEVTKIYISLLQHSTKKTAIYS